jgi:NADH:ubiquinone oxidoreductase subunit 5 (subunit L)/multisubunit Na+/H+ antiporter MnhA subunit
MTMPLIVLALGAILLSVVLTPAWPWLHGYLTGEPAQFDITRLIQPMLFVSLVLVAVGIGLGVVLYRRAGVQDRHRSAEVDPLEYAQPALFHFLENKMRMDEFYDRTIIAFAAISARASNWMDRYVWDGLVRVLGRLGQLFGIFTRGVDERGINAGVDETMTSTRSLGRVMSSWHSGQIQTYLGVVAVGMLALLLLYAWLV